MDAFIGMIKLALAAPEHPAWLPCDGRMLASSEYPELFALIGTRFGGNDLQFQIPAFQPMPNAVAIVNVKPLSQRVMQPMVAQICYAISDKPQDGWLICDGSLVSRADYPILSRLLGSQYGGNATHLALPLAPEMNGIYTFICVHGSDPGGAPTEDDD